MLPENFVKRMKETDPEEADALLSALEEEPKRGLRVHRGKIDPARFLSLGRFPVTPLPYGDGDSFLLETDAPIGNTPEHLSGMFYLQDPGAMLPVCAVDLTRGAVCADLCAAPGGKSGAIADRIGDGGVLLCNEYVPKRAKVLVGNIERLGVKNAIVTSMDTGELAKLFSAVFDFVLVDAPCSGEGMFRKNDLAISEWSPENVVACAARQKDILDNAAKIVKSGGILLYSTCTFSPEENEMQVDAFLSRHPEFELIPAKDEVKAVTREGISFPGCRTENIRECRRVYPSRTPGEGQFFAILRKKDTGDAPRFLYKDAAFSPRKPDTPPILSLLSATIGEEFLPRVRLLSGRPTLLPQAFPIPPFAVFSAGVLLGEEKGKTLVPSHQLFSAYGSLFENKLDLDPADPRLFAYLHGEEIAADLPDGYAVVTVAGAPLGGGKVSAGRLKNYFPKGLRV